MNPQAIARHLHPSQQFERELKIIFEPLFLRSLVKFFSYNRYFRNQTWIGLYSDTTPVQKDLSAGRGPLFVYERGVRIKEGVYLHKDLNEILKMEVDPVVVDDFFLQADNPDGKAVVQNGLLIIRKAAGYDESFYFSLKDNVVIDRCYFYGVVNELKKYSHYFLGKCRTIIAYAEKTPVSYRIPNPNCNNANDVCFISVKSKIPVDVKKFSFSTNFGEVFLSQQELNCLRLIAQGYTQREISFKLTLSHKTVESYVRSIKNKLVAETKEELTRYFSDFAPLDYQQ